MNSALQLAPRSFPSRVADLGFTTVLPTDWISHELPAEDADVSNPTAFIPLAVVTAPHAALVFAFAARPAYDDGTLHDWAMYLLNHNKLQPRAVGRGVVAGVSAAVGEATLASELGPMIVRFAFLEDGNRLLNLTLSAPELLAGAVTDAWFAMLQSFRLESPRGSRFAIEDHPDHTVPPPEPEASRMTLAEQAALETPPEEEADSRGPAESILESCAGERAGHSEQPAANSPSATDNESPAWWDRAIALEAQDELKAAEDVIRQGCEHLGFAASTAQMYRRRMHRLQSAGDHTGARAAFKKASEFIFFYASLATSGGEGAALSAERDTFRAQLVAEYGSDPEAADPLGGTTSVSSASPAAPPSLAAL